MPITPLLVDDIYLVLLFMFVLACGFALVQFALNRQRMLVATGQVIPNGKAALQQEVKRLQNTVEILLGRIAQQEDELAAERQKLWDTQAKLDAALGRISALEARQTSSELPPLVKPLLLICGTDARVVDRDRHALNRAGVRFQRILAATKPLVQSEIRRRVQDGTLYCWLHISAHGGPEGVLLADGMADADYWHETLAGLGRTRTVGTRISCIFLASCSSNEIADELAGLVGTVIVFGESVPNEAAADFTYAFWKRMIAGRTPDQGYSEALGDVPSVSEYVDIRHG